MSDVPKNSYFLGIGGIGMSALARYYHSKGCRVSGYDLTKTPLTEELEKQGIQVNYIDNPELIPEWVKTDKQSLIIYTPAIPSEQKQLNYFLDQGFNLLKRAEILGKISKNYRTIAIAGTHGKTTTTAMVAHVMSHSHLGCNAFVGGIMTESNTNIILNATSDWMVIEADEFDRSFLNLSPDLLGITSIDPDHLDIYLDAEQLSKAFVELIGLIKGGFPPVINDKVTGSIAKNAIRYGFSKTADIRLMSLGYNNGFHRVTVVGLDTKSIDFELMMPGLHNAQNAVLAATLCKMAGCSIDEIKQGLGSFKGVKRRFEYVAKTPKTIFIDDYAHHPKEIDALIESVRNLYPDKKITGIFQPHLYSRTRDFAEEFAESLSKLDNLYLMDIYPAREKPIPGIDAKYLLEKVKLNQKSIVNKQNVPRLISVNKPEILLTIGAGDIGQLIPAVKQAVTDNYESE